jgi:hypothetical protein
MSWREQWSAFLAVAAAAGCVISSCGGSSTAANAKKPSVTDQLGQGDDKSRCDFEGRNDREVQETAGPGSFQPNIRRVYKLMGSGDEMRRVLLCREVDTNLDGVKDVVRIYNDRGEALHERADANFDGNIDTWITFARGRISKHQIDDNGDSQPDVTKYYVAGKLSRANRDKNHDGKPDVWEIYDEGRLQRMGVDLDHDGHVDRWDRDQAVQRALEERERAQTPEQPAASEGALDGGTPAPADAAVTDARVGARQR